MAVSRRAGEAAQGGWSSRRNHSISAYRHELASGLGESLIPLQYLDEMIDVLAAVARIQTDANAGAPHRYGPTRDPTHMDSLFPQYASELPPILLGSEPDSTNGGPPRYV